MLQGFKLFFKIAPYIKDTKRKSAIFVAYFYSFLQYTLQGIQPLIFAFLIDNVLIGGKIELILPVLIISIVIALIVLFFAIMNNSIFRFLSISMTLDLRTFLLKHVRNISIQEIEKRGPGNFLSILGFDTGVIANFVTHITVQIITQTYMLIIAIVILFVFDWKLGVVGLVMNLLLFFIPRIYRKWIYKFSHHVRTHNEEISTVLIESIEGSKLIRLHGLEEWEEKRNDVYYKNLKEASTFETLFNVLSNESSRFVFCIFIVLIYWIGSVLTLDGHLTIGMIVAAISYLNSAMVRVQQINQFFGELQRSEVSLKRIEEFLKVPFDQISQNTKDKEDLKTNNEIITTEIKRNNIIEINNLNLTINGVNILKGIDLEIKKGQKVALLGFSGSGKSTIYKILTGMMPYSCGEIFIKGESFSEMTKNKINSNIGMVFQEPFLFKDTIYENILIGNLSASPEEVYDAACKANLKSLIDNLPDGLYTKLNTKGCQLSGGERQRITIARVFLQKPEILLLDEPTSSLDKVTENDVIIALDSLMKNRTTIISTHRLETIQNADLIYLLDNGIVIDQGSHFELLNKSPHYCSMVSTFEQDIEENKEKNIKNGKILVK